VRQGDRDITPSPPREREAAQDVAPVVVRVEGRATFPIHAEAGSTKAGTAAAMVVQRVPLGSHRVPCALDPHFVVL